MSAPKFTYSKTKISDTIYEDDFSIKCDGVEIGRVFKHEFGPKGNQWSATLKALIAKTPLNQTCQDKASAFEAVKRAYLKQL